MKILIPAHLGHIPRCRIFWRLHRAFTSWGHKVYNLKSNREIVEEGKDSEMIILLGACRLWKDIKDLPGLKVLWAHGLQANRPDDSRNDILQELYDKCDAVAFHSEYSKHTINKYLGKRDGPIILNAGWDFTDDVKPKKIKKGEKVKVVSMAFWRTWKRWYEIPRLFRPLADKNIHCDIIGTPFEKGFVAPREERNAPNVHYMGSGHPEDFRKYHFYFMPAFNDQSPATPAEAMGFGLPVITVNSGGTKDLVGDGGIIIDTDPFIDEQIAMNNEDVIPRIDEKKFQKAMFEMIDNYDEWVKRSRKRVKEVANAEHSAQQFLDLYASHTGSNV